MQISIHKHPVPIWQSFNRLVHTRMVVGCARVSGGRAEVRESGVAVEEGEGTETFGTINSTSIVCLQ